MRSPKKETTAKSPLPRTAILYMMEGGAWFGTLHGKLLVSR